MKGSMIFSLITLCVVMLFMEARISRFLHGEPEAAAQDDGFLPDMDFLSDWGEAVTSVWQDCTDFLAAASDTVTARPDNEEVVITEDTIQQVWVWRDKGAIQSARDEPAHADDARQVMIPEDMTASEFFGETTTDDTANKTARQSQGQARASSGQDTPAVQGGADTGTALDQFSPEQRRAMLDQGTEVLQQKSAASDGRAPR